MDNALTLNDIRVKTCFICLDSEEGTESPGSNSSWVHPCPNCSLLAHRSCLSRWIDSLPRRGPAPTSRRARATMHAMRLFDLTAFRCPRCRKRYEFSNPGRPRLYTLGVVVNTVLYIGSELVSVACTLAGIQVVYLIPAAVAAGRLAGHFLYEIALVQSYIGTSTMQLIPTVQPEALIRSVFVMGSLIPFRMLLPGAVPEWIVPLYISMPYILYLCLPTTATDRPHFRAPSSASISLWPPSPALIGLVIVPLLRPVYRRLRAFVGARLLGCPPPQRQRRYFADGIKTFFAPRRRNATQPGSGSGSGSEGNALSDLDPPAVEVASAMMEKDQTSVTHQILQAVCTIYLPSLFGKLLCAAAAAGAPGRSAALRGFLGMDRVRPSRVITSSSSYMAYWAMVRSGDGVLCKSRALAGLLLGGSWMWADMDPVWWRNSLGYGLYTVATDCLDLLRLWLQKRQIESRTVRSYDFAGVDATQLDLLQR